MIDCLKPLFSLRDSVAFVLLAVIVAVSRAPFLGAGYGLDPDAWRIVLAARSIASEGVYSISRFPGYPVPEMLSSLLISGGPWALNGATAFFSVVAMIFFALSLKRLEIPNYFLGGVALAFTPLVYVNSVNSMDYLWALSFLMIGLYGSIRGWAVAAGVAVGLAMGCRITSALMILPLLFLLINNPLLRSGWAAVRFVLATLITAAVAFWPVYEAYGWSFFTFYDVSYPGWLTIVKRITVHVWGRIGLFALVAASAGLIFWPRLIKRPLPILASGWAQSWVWWFAVVIYVIIFFRLPVDAAYLIPAIPFIILLLAKHMRPKWFALFAFLLVIAPYVSICRSAGICCGDILSDQRTRNRELAYSQAVLEACDSLDDNAVVVAGWRQPQLVVESARQRKSTTFLYLLDAAGLAEVLDDRRTIYYLRGMAQYNHDVHGIDLAERGAKLLPINPLFD